MLGLSLSSCPFQHPFYFIDDPVLQPVLDEFGEAMADQVDDWMWEVLRF